MFKNSDWITKFNNILIITNCDSNIKIFNKYKKFYSKEITVKSQSEIKKFLNKKPNYDSIIYDIEYDDNLINSLTKKSKPIFFTNYKLPSNIINICINNKSEFITPYLENDFFVFNSLLNDKSHKESNIFSIYNYEMKNTVEIDFVINYFEDKGYKPNDLFFITNYFFPIFLNNGFVIDPDLYQSDNLTKIISEKTLENYDKTIIIFFKSKFNNFFQTLLNLYFKNQNIIVINRSGSENFIKQKMKTLLHNYKIDPILLYSENFQTQ